MLNCAFRMEGIPLKKQKVSHIDDEEFDIQKCILCQDTAKVKPISTENGRACVWYAAEIRQGTILKRLTSLIEGTNFCYHVNNKCYKRYTLQKTLGNILLQPSEEANPETTSKDLNERVTRSKIASRNPASDNEDFYKKICVVCGAAKQNGVYIKYRISEKDRAKKFLNATLHFQDDVYTRTSDLEDESSIFGADLFCHKYCIRSYFNKYSSAVSKNSKPPETNSIFNNGIERFLIN